MRITFGIVIVSGKKAKFSGVGVLDSEIVVTILYRIPKQP